MKQFTETEAFEFAKSGKWKEMSDRELVGFQLYQRLLCVPFSVFHGKIEKVLGRPVYTHEFGLNYDGLIAEYLGLQDSPTLQEIIEMIPEEKRIVIATP